MDDQKLAIALDKVMRTYTDFPKPGILFRDFMPVLLDANLVGNILDNIVSRLAKNKFSFDAVAALEARGFLLGPSLALKLSLPFVPIRKPGKLPGNVVSVEYEKEYGKDTLEMQVGAIRQGARVMIFDDVLATGGTAEAAVKLAQRAGASVSCAVFVVELCYLYGSQKLKDTPYFSLVQYDS